MPKTLMPRPKLSFYDVFPDAPKLTIVDVGASEIDQEPEYQRLLEAGRASVVAFEPDAKAREGLAGQPNLTVLPHFVGDGAEATFYETNTAVTGSLFPPNAPFLRKFQGLEEMMRQKSASSVQTVRIDDLVEIPAFDYLKMDIQGSELAVLRGAEEKLKSCLLIQTEVSFVEMYRGQPLFADVDAHLRARGFQFHSFSGFGSRAYRPAMVDNNPHAGAFQWLWADAFYVRDILGVEALSNDALMKAAALLNDVVGAFDYTLAMLAEIDRRDGTAAADSFVRRLRES